MKLDLEKLVKASESLESFCLNMWLDNTEDSSVRALAGAISQFASTVSEELRKELAT